MNKRSIWRTYVAIAVMTLFVIFAACNKSKPTVGDKPLQVGYLPLSAAIPLYVAKDQGMFEKHGVEVHLVKYQNGATLAEDVITHRIDAASPGPGDVYLAKDLQTPGRFQIYLHTAYRPENFIYSILVRKDSGITSLEQLKGKRVAVFPGETNALLLSLFFRKEFGWNSENDVEILKVAPNLQLDALEAGEFDALCPLEPMGTIGASRPALQFLDRGTIERGVHSPLYITVHALSAETVRSRPEDARRFVAAMEEAVDFIRSNESAARAILPKYTALNDELARTTPLGDLRKLSEVETDEFQTLADLLTQHGALPKPTSVSSLYFKPSSR